MGFALKHNLDRLVATYGFHRPWGLFNYWVPVRDVARVTQVQGKEAIFLATMLAMALPFIWVGVVMTLKRLRSAQLPSSLVILFFIPFVNLLFFLALCLIPERSGFSEDHQRSAGGSFLARNLPESALASTVISLLFTVPIGLALVLLGVEVLRNYGWGIFALCLLLWGSSPLWFTALGAHARFPVALP